MPLENSLTAARPGAVPRSTTDGPLRSFARRHSMLLYILLAYAITTFGWLPSILTGRTMLTTPLPVALLAGWGPSLAGLMTAGLLDGWSGVKGLLGRFVQKGVGLRWYGLVTIGYAGLWGLATLIQFAMGRPLDFVNLGVYDFLPIPGASPWLLILPFSLLVMVTGGAMNEEIGWRGFLLPRLLERLSPLTASLIMAPLWWVWHLPQWLLSGPIDLGAWFGFLGGLTLLTIIMTWIFTKTRGSLSIAVLLHTAANVCSGFFPRSVESTFDWLQIGLVALIVLGWLVRSTARGRGAGRG